MAVTSGSGKGEVAVVVVMAAVRVAGRTVVVGC
jgi:hypothetical protein